MKEKYSYTESIEICEKALDILDIKQFLTSGAEVRNIMHAIEDYVEDGDGEDVWKVEYFMKEYPEVFYNPPELFNYMTEDEFLEYCKKRYPEVHWNYEFIERYQVTS